MISFHRFNSAIILLLVFMVSCTAPKDIVYFQDINSGTELNIGHGAQIRIQPQDELRIIVSTTDQRLTDQFNLSSASNQTTTQNGGLFYTVDSQGNIVFPVLGTLHVAGLTREEVASLIRRELQSRNLVKEPVVIVDFVNLSVAVLGEVRSPGRISINKDKVTILDAIADAGDLTIDGLRTDVKVIRNNGDKQMVYEVDLTDAASVYGSPVYYLQQDDVIYVSPNKKARRSSTVNGNTVQSYGFWISIASFLISLGVIFLK